MLDKLNLYDLLAYLIPGGVVLGLGYWLGSAVFTGRMPGFKGDVLDFAGTLGGSILLIAVSYALGHLVQSVGEWWENRGNQKRHCRLSEQMLMPGNDQFYSPTAQDLIRERARVTFGFPAFPHSHERRAYILRLRELFELCYRFIVNKQFDQHTEVYLAIAGLSRGLMVTTWFGLLLSVLLVVREALSEGFPNGFGPIHKATYESNQFLAGILFTVIFLMAWGLSNFHYFRFRKLFAASVWNSFLASNPGGKGRKGDSA